MAKAEAAKLSPQNPKNSSPKQPQQAEMFSPGFRSVAAMAGWDEEAILLASLIVEDTPDREIKYKKRSHFPSKTPPSTKSRTKRKAKRRGPVSDPVPVLNLEEEETGSKDVEKKKAESKIVVNEENKMEGELPPQEGGVSSLNSSALPCMDRLREELSCAICLEICFEPSTTTCGHSFCKKCLRSAADKCGKRCPKCRQLISNGRSCTVNTVLWNTIQLLFPEEVEARKAAAAIRGQKSGRPLSPPKVSSSIGSASSRVPWILRGDSSEVDASDRRSSRAFPQVSSRADVNVRSFRILSEVSRRAHGSVRQRRGVQVPGQDEDAALALRLQREEFMEAFRGNETEHSGQQGRINSSVSLARANLRAMASRAITLRASRGRNV